MSHRNKGHGKKPKPTASKRTKIRFTDRKLGIEKTNKREISATNIKTDGFTKPKNVSL